MNKHRQERDDQTVDEIAGVDEADVYEAERHDPDDTMERAGRSHHTKDELALPSDSDADPDEEPPRGK
jgi:hypothetical protein